MRYCFLFSFLFLLFHGVSAQGFNRMYVNLLYGNSNHWNWGAQVCFLNHFTMGVGVGNTSEKTGPVACSSTSLLFSKCEQLKNRYRDISLLGGITTRRMEKNLDFDLLVGVVWQNALTNENMVLKYNEYSHSEWVEHTTSFSKTMGFVLKGSMSFECTRGFGFMMSLEKHFNSVRPVWNIMGGIQVGLVRDYQRIRK